MTTTPRMRSDLAALPAYQAGARPKSGAGRPVFSLASNETHFGPLPGVVEVISEQARLVHRYPDPGSADLTAALSARLDVDPGTITLGTGSVAVCQQAVTAACGPGDEVVFAWRSFEAYPIITTLAGGRAVTVPLLADGRHDLQRMLTAITDRTRLVLVCTPNNPTGPAVSAAELTDFLDQVPEQVLVVIDEAYHEFGWDADGRPGLDGIEVARGRSNVAVIRTFSKAYGLAGLRVGYGVAPEPVATALRKVALPFGVSALAQVAAVASLGHDQELLSRIGTVRAERHRVVTAARALGFRVPDTLGNFYWLPLGDGTAAFAAACLETGVSVRGFAGEGVRVTVAEPEANDLVLGVLAGFSQVQ